MSGKRSRSSQRRSSRVAEVSPDERREQLRAFYRRRHRQKVVGWTLLVVAALVAMQHFLRHTDSLDVAPFISMAVQDLAIGYPMGAVLLIIAVVLLGQSDEPPSKATPRRR